MPTGDWSTPRTVRPAAPNAQESRPSPQPMSMMLPGMPSQPLTNSKNVEPEVYCVLL